MALQVLQDRSRRELESLYDMKGFRTNRQARTRLRCSRCGKQFTKTLEHRTGWAACASSFNRLRNSTRLEKFDFPLCHLNHHHCLKVLL